MTPSEIIYLRAEVDGAEADEPRIVRQPLTRRADGLARRRLFRCAPFDLRNRRE